MLEKIKKLMAEGKTNQEIIDELGLSEEDLNDLQKEAVDVGKIDKSKTTDKFLGLDKPKATAKKQTNEEEDEDSDDDEGSDDEDGKKKENPFKKESIELVQISTGDLEVSSEVSDLLGTDETLSEDTRDKTRVLFETAVVNAVNEQLPKLQEQYNDLLQKKLEEKSEELINQVDSYMDHVVESWMKENKLAVESGIRTEIAESLINDIKEVFENHQIEIPESDVSSLEEVGEVNASLEAKLDESIKANIELKKQLVEMKKLDIMQQISENLTESEVDKLSGMISHVDYEDETQYLSSVATIKESMFDKTTDIPESLTEENDDLDTAGTNKTLTDEDEETSDKNSNLSYAEAISRSVKR